MEEVIQLNKTNVKFCCILNCPNEATKRLELSNLDDILDKVDNNKNFINFLR